MDETSFPFQEGRRNAGRKQEAEGALPTLCPCCTEKQWTSRGDASQTAGLEVGLLQSPSVCKGQRKPGAMNLGLHVAGTHGRDVEHEIRSREVSEGSGRTWGVIVMSCCQEGASGITWAISTHPLGLPILFLPLMFWSSIMTAAVCSV